MRPRRAAAAILLAALLAASGAARAAPPLSPSPARQKAKEQPALTPEERREAGEFLLALDARWRGAQQFSAVLDEMFVSDYLKLFREHEREHGYLFARTGVAEQLSDAELKRAHAAQLDLLYLMGRLHLTFEESKRLEKAGKAARAPRRSAEAEKGAGEGDPAAESEGDDDGKLLLEEALSPAVVEALKANPLIAAAWSEDDDAEKESEEDDEKWLPATASQLMEFTSTLEDAAKLLRGRLKDLESRLPGGAVSAVPREDEGEGERPKVQPRVLAEPWMNRPAGTRVVCGYVSILHVHLVKEQGRYRVLAAYFGD